eukprot:TRINITY_DN4755_c0_g1_i9.p1 TRINITY_DN4755_c0_g1~~TRINITY_DN4755_c0_g1_i9.p1  ORF type:complete len:316 (+),score=75.95 TRINITY_DN4755_c0_g1_i9:109-948(+)
MRKHKEEFVKQRNFKDLAKAANSSNALLPVPIPSLVRVKSEAGTQEILVSESTKFFSCRKEQCSGGLCLQCKKPVQKEQIPNHVCAEDPLLLLYEQVLETLAQAASRTCPLCYFPGMKDLACTHISCDCGAHWCYHCGKDESQLPDGFDLHNDWQRSTPDGVGRCPMYLHYKYVREDEDFMNNEERAAEGSQLPDGGFEVHNDWQRSTPDGVGRCPMYLHYKYVREDEDFMNNEERAAEVALERYHLKLQGEAVQRLEEMTDAALWTQMLEKYFPKGIF